VIIESLSFEADSLLRKLKRKCSKACGLKSIWIVTYVGFIHEFTFLRRPLEIMLIRNGKDHCVIDRDLLVDAVYDFVIRCCGLEI
jgi:hypothetical protein